MMSIDGMDFGAALDAIKQGKMVCRAGWNGKGMWLWMIERCDDMHVQGIGEWITHLKPWIGMKTVDGGFVPWLASQTDVLAEDWQIVEI